MWKSIIIVTSLLTVLGTANAEAAGLESNTKNTHQERIERNELLDDWASSNEMMKSFYISEDISTGLIFGLDKNYQQSHEGPREESGGMGIGIGFSFSF